MLATGRRAKEYRDLFQRHPQPMYVYDPASLRILDVNDAACLAYGYTRTQFLRMTLLDLYPEDERAAVLQAESERVGSRARTSLWRHRRADGATFYVDIAENGFTFDRKPARVVCANDASPRLAVSRALSDSRAALAQAEELAQVGSFDIDLRSGEVRWSPVLFRLLGVDPARERPLSLRTFDEPEDAALIAAEIDRARIEHDAFSIEHRIHTRDGRERFVFERGQFTYERGRAQRASGVVLDITDHKTAERRLRHLAERDELTGLPNRTLLREILAATIERAASEQRSFALLYLDLDRFKEINDTMAQAAGDELLRAVATRLVAVVGEAGTVCRAGGDEFTTILDQIEDEAGSISIAGELLSSVACPFVFAHTQLLVTASIGVALFPRDGETPDALLRSADVATYAAKARGGNAVAAYTPDPYNTAPDDMELAGDLHFALENQELEVAYQPIVEVSSGRVVALEALARWSRNGHPVEPFRFVSLAESHGMILRLGAFVLERACSFARELLDEGHDITMCVNISVWQFRDPRLDARVSHALEHTGLPAERLQLEITETAYIGPDADMRSIAALERLGVRLSIDDFGTGYSSLGYLKRLPVDSLKIDRSFVSDILFDAADQAIVRAVIAVGRNLDLSVIAEGVETEAQADYLRLLGCTHLQGYHFAKPLLPDALRTMLQSEPETETVAEYDGS
jgi:diguanylate cyclase (GGDEF)-like protein/PAS domain S-box-containing protein